MPVDDIVMKPIDKVRRLRVVGYLADGHRIAVSILFAFFKFNRNAAVFDVTDISVVQRIEMGDVQKVLDQQEIIGRNFHRPDDFGFPISRSHFRQPRRLARVGKRRIARPQPNQSVLLHDRIRADDRLRRDRTCRV